jgi:N-acetylated-alpha-linked acidic dipeptidase
MKKIAGLLSAAAAGLAVLAGESGGPLRGFRPARAAWERNYEERLARLPAASECGEFLQTLTREPHVAGTPGNERVANFIAAEYRRAGLEVEMPSYDVLLSYPKSASLEIEGEPAIRLPRAEEGVASADPLVAVPWNAYAPSGDLSAEIVYVNHGSASDYDRLASMGVDVRGKIALARYFGGYRGGKSIAAEKRGVAALLVYSDPIDDGWFKGDVFPKGPWGPPSHVQRGGDVYDFLVPGDPLTPGWASLPGARRIPESESTILPRIPMMPLSARDAALLLDRLRGPAAPDGWQGVATGSTYHVGPGPLRVHLAIANTREVRTIRNVIGTLRGTDEPDRKIILSNHHDAWVFGAVDPSSGTASLLSLAHAMGKLAREGLRPRRTIVFASWDAEEYTLTGSTEWGEQHEADLSRNAIACLNVDEAAHGTTFSASASPLLFSILREVAADLPDPGAPGRSLADNWHAGGEGDIASYATGADPSDPLPVSILGSGSDYTVFFNRLGVPSTDLVFDGPYGVYHSTFDDFRYVATAADPGFRHTASMARYVGVLALRLANADLYPFDAGAYGREIARYAGDLAASPEGKPLAADLGRLAEASLAWGREAKGRADRGLARLAEGDLRPDQAARENEWLISLERSMLSPDGIPGRPWFRHRIYAPLPSYYAETLPAVREALAAGKDDVARRELEGLIRAIEAATGAARPR